MSTPEPPPEEVRLRLRAPGRPDRHRILAARDLPVTLRHLDWSGPVTVTVVTPAGGYLAVTADGRGGWRAVWHPGIDGVPQVATDLPGGTDDVFRAYASLLSGGLELALAWRDSPGEVTDVALDAWETGEVAGGLESATPRWIAMVYPVVILIFLVVNAFGVLAVAWLLR